MLNGTGKEFEIAWDGTTNTIIILTNRPYTVTGGEMKMGDGVNRNATLSTSRVLLDGWEAALIAYNIDGNNFFQLRGISTKWT